MIDGMAGETAAGGVKQLFPCGRIACTSGGRTLSGGRDQIDQIEKSGARNVYR
jgi:hypothetical protein